MRRIPIHQEKAASLYIANLMSKGIIEKVEDDDPCEFISPAIFVPKANGKVQLVTDYKYINQFLDRPVQPFMSSCHAECFGLSSLTVCLGLLVRSFPKGRLKGLVWLVLQGPGAPPLDGATIPDVSVLGPEHLSAVLLVEL